MLSQTEQSNQETDGNLEKLMVIKRLMPGHLITEQTLSHFLSVEDDSIAIGFHQLQEESFLGHLPDNGF